MNGISSHFENDRSLFNMKEVYAVVDQITEIISSEVNGRKIECAHIGVVTPYKRQCRIIGQLCRKMGFNDITIGTAEVFQGLEKPVMILSTVRTSGILGFVSSEQVRIIPSLIHCFHMRF